MGNNESSSTNGTSASPAVSATPAAPSPSAASSSQRTSNANMSSIINSMNSAAANAGGSNSGQPPGAYKMPGYYDLLLGIVISSVSKF
jgi:hypothetical protein